MVKRLPFLALLLVLLPLHAWAAEFTATVDSPQVVAGQPFNLELTLSGATAQTPPDLSPLHPLFIIVAQAQTSNFSVINGSMTSSTGLQLTLTTMRQGPVTIPPISIDTADGTLTTQPVQINVNPPGQLPQATASDQPVTLGAAADPRDPYQDQPVRYEVDVIAGTSLLDLTLDDFSIPNAIIDKPTQPKVYDKIRNGTPVKIIEYDFVITPLKPGRIVIPAPTIHGNEVGIPVNMPDPLNTGFGNLFGMMQNMGSHPISLSGNEVTLDVKAPPVDMNPWLPLSSLRIEDDWKGVDNAKVGEPVTRKITQLAEGGAGSQLPNLEDQQNHSDFKVYADKADVGTNNGRPGEAIIGWRHETFTLIPKKPGTLTIPAVRIAWWNVKDNKIEYAELPPHTLNVTGEPETQSSPAPAAAAAETPAAPAAASNGSVKLLYLVGGLALALLLGAGFWIWQTQKKLAALQQPVRARPAAPPPPPPVGNEDLKQARTADDLRRVLQKFSAARWNTSPNAPLEKILSAAPQALRADFESVIKSLTAALYAGRPADIDALKCDIEKLFKWKSPKTSGTKSGDRLQDLNPN